MKYTLRQLDVFLAVAKAGSLTRAAEQLSMSQSAASGALKEFEARFNLQLFDRVGKRLKINSTGLAIQAKALEVMQRAQELENELVGVSDMGQIKVGATMTVGNYLLIDVLAGFKQQYPQAEVELEVANTERIVDKVISFELDVGLIEGEVSRPEIDVIPWREDELITVCSPQHPLADKAAQGLTREELVAIDWIVREKGSGTRQAFERGMYGVLQDLHYIMEFEQIEAIKRAVSLNMGMACLSKLSVQTELQQGSLIAVNIPDRDFKRYFYAVLHKDKYLSAGVEKWLDYCGFILEEIFFFRRES